MYKHTRTAHMIVLPLNLPFHVIDMYLPNNLLNNVLHISAKDLMWYFVMFGQHILTNYEFVFFSVYVKETFLHKEHNREYSKMFVIFVSSWLLHLYSNTAENLIEIKTYFCPKIF